MGTFFGKFCCCCKYCCYEAIEKEGVDCGPPSLRNIGATCYLNSAFQGISSCNNFVKDINDLYNIDGHHTLKQLKVFRELIEILNGRSRSNLEISKNPIFSHWNKFGQQDSYELLAYALNEVYNELRQHKENTTSIPLRNLTVWLQELLPMRLILQYKIECGCKKITNCPLQSDLAFHVTIPMQKRISSLDTLINKYFLEDIIIDYKCDEKNCNGIGAKRIVKLKKPLPRTICIHLQRTYWNGRKMVKIDNKVEFKSKLTIKSRFCLDEKVICSEAIEGEHQDTMNSNLRDEYKEQSESMNENSLNKSIDKDKIGSVLISLENNASIMDDKLINLTKNRKELNVNKNCEERDNDYDLVSVIEHSGTANSGHYVCFKKSKNQWYLTNDSSVRTIDESITLSCQPYILFYEKSEEQK